MKVEEFKRKKSHFSSKIYLDKEYNILKKLNSSGIHCIGNGIPIVYNLIEGISYKMMIFQLLGNSLSQIKKESKNQQIPLSLVVIFGMKIVHLLVIYSLSIT